MNIETLHEFETKIRLDESTDELINAYARFRKLKKAAFVRRLVLIGLDVLLNEDYLELSEKNEVRR